MRKSDLVVKVIKYKLQNGKPPKMICGKCGNVKHFVGTRVYYVSTLIQHKGTEDHMIERHAARVMVADRKTPQIFSNKVLKKFLDETANDDLTNEPELIGVSCLRCGAGPEDIIDRDELEELAERGGGAK